VEIRDASLPGYELGSCRIMARKELGGAKKTSSDSEAIINPLPGYD
jgi:hypothetical protein